MHEVAQETVSLNTSGKALVADDERTNRIMISAILKQIGYEVIHAENGAEAIKLFRTDCDYDFI